MNRSELNSAVELEGDDVFLASPVPTVMLGWYWETSVSLLALRTFSFPCIRAVAAVDGQATAAFQNPHSRVVVAAAPRSKS